jgi:hypothetical protein
MELDVNYIQVIINKIMKLAQKSDSKAKTLNNQTKLFVFKFIRILFVKKNSKLYITSSNQSKENL